MLKGGEVCLEFEQPGCHVLGNGHQRAHGRAGCALRRVIEWTFAVERWSRDIKVRPLLLWLDEILQEQATVQSAA